MKDFQVNFTADNLQYRVPISAETDGKAQDKFARWFTDKFKPERGIVGVAKVTSIVAVESKDDKIKKALGNYFNLWK